MAVKLVPLDDEVIRGIKGIVGETPTRQGKAFRHYRQDLDTVKAEMSDRLSEFEFAGTFFEN